MGVSLTVLVLEDVGGVEDAYVAPSPTQQNSFILTQQSVVNTVNVALAPAVPTPSDVTPDVTYVAVVDDVSVAGFGVQETPVVITLLASLVDAELLARYLIRAVPVYWLSGFQIMLEILTDAQKTLIAQLEIGNQITVIINFPAPVTPATLTQVLFVEGLFHEVSPALGHYVTIYTAPAETFTPFILGSSLLGDTSKGLS